eukprot:6324801-Pyramimonas_sp.AAC.1
MGQCRHRQAWDWQTKRLGRGQRDSSSSLGDASGLPNGFRPRLRFQSVQFQYFQAASIASSPARGA